MPIVRRWSMLLLLLASATNAGAAEFVLTTPADAVDALPGDGECATVEDQCTLRAAIQEANAQPGPDSIVLAAGTYVLALPGRGEDAAASGDLDVTDALSLTGAGAEATIIDGDRLDTVLQLHAGAGTVTLTGLSLARGDYRTEPGCGVLDCPGAGGLVNPFGVELTLRHVDLRDHVSQGLASALYNRGCVDGDHVRIVGNDGLDTSVSSLVLATVVSGRSGTGETACLTLDHSEIAGNGLAAGTTRDAAIYADRTTLILRRSLVSGNHGTHASAFTFNSQNDVLIENTTITGNTTPGISGVLLNDGGSVVRIRHSTITGNVGGALTGGIHDVHGGFGLVTLSNTLLIGNRLAWGEFSDCRRGLISAGGLMVGTPVHPTVPFGPGLPCWVQAGPGDQYGTQLSFGPLADHGGATASLLPLGPAIDSGVAGECVDVDQRDRPRPAGAGCDLGAVELGIDDDRLFFDGFDIQPR